MNLRSTHAVFDPRLNADTIDVSDTIWTENRETPGPRDV